MTSTTEIMHEMDRTRDEIRSTLSAIEGRLSVDRMVQHYIAPTRDQALEYGRVFSDAVRANPLALGVTAVGIGWLMLGPRKPARALPAPNDGGYGRPRPRRSGLGSQDVEDAVRLDPSRAGVGPLAADEIGEYPETHSDFAADPVTAGTRRPDASVGSASRKLGETAQKGWSSIRDAAETTASRMREAAETGAGRAATVLEDASDSIRDTAGRAYRKTRKVAADVSDSVRDSAGGVSTKTRHAVAGVPKRVRETAGAAGGYAREHPMTVAAALAVGGAALALLVARRSMRQRNGADDGVMESEEFSGTPCASGAQGSLDAARRKPVPPITPEDEQRVYASGDISSAAIGPQSRDDGGSVSGARNDVGTIGAGVSRYPAEASSGSPAGVASDAGKPGTPPATDVTVLPAPGDRADAGHDRSEVSEKTPAAERAEADERPAAVLRAVGRETRGG